jgi:putative hydrolase of the HAD superfamily
MTYNKPDTLIFDWGDTIMCDFREYSGPMCDWPRVEAVFGIETVLPTLKDKYRMILATNATESGERGVWEALRRVNLDGFFERIFTAKELGSAKPDPRFFQMVVSVLGCQPDQAVMIGDNYASDILGAKNAELRAIWYNPHFLEVDSGHPSYDAEIRNMLALPETLEQMSLPDEAECLSWLEEQKATTNLIAHCREVARTAYRLAVWMRQTGESVDPLLTHRGGLLHDLDKITARQMGEQHGEYAARLLEERGQPRLAQIARRHQINLSEVGSQPETWEQKLVFYADKLVEQNQLVSLTQRLEALILRYPEYAERFRRFKPMLLEMESHICSRIGITKEALYAKLGIE